MPSPCRHGGPLTRLQRPVPPTPERRLHRLNGLLQTINLGCTARPRPRSRPCSGNLDSATGRGHTGERLLHPAERNAYYTDHGQVVSPQHLSNASPTATFDGTPGTVNINQTSTPTGTATRPTSSARRRRQQTGDRRVMQHEWATASIRLLQRRHHDEAPQRGMSDTAALLSPTADSWPLFPGRQRNGIPRHE